MFVSILLLRKHLHRLPWLTRLMLLPPAGDDQQTWLDRESVVDYRELLHTEGVTRTTLLPSGKAIFGNRLVDVISEGDVIERGCRVYVIEASGNRVVVRPVAG